MYLVKYRAACSSRLRGLRLGVRAWALAVFASATVINLASTIRSSTRLRRCLANLGLTNGEYLLGAGGMAARVAISASVSWSTVLLKYTQAESATP